MESSDGGERSGFRATRPFHPPSRGRPPLTPVEPPTLAVAQPRRYTTAAAMMDKSRSCDDGVWRGGRHLVQSRDT